MRGSRKGQRRGIGFVSAFHECTFLSLGFGGLGFRVEVPRMKGYSFGGLCRGYP